MQTVIDKIRDLIGDGYQYTTDVYTYFTSKVFTLSSANIDVLTLVVLKNGVVYSPTNYTYNANTGRVTVTGTLVVNDVLEFDYNAAKKYSDTELKGYIRAALTYLATEKYEVFIAKSDNEIFPTPTEAEENLIALLASILITGTLRSYRTPEITIEFNLKETMEEKIHRVIYMFRKTYGTVRYIKTDRDIKIDREDE